MKAWFLVALIVSATAAGDILQSREMKRHGEVREITGVLQALIRRRFLILAVACMAISFFAFMALVQTADLSFAVPATAASFVLETILARLILKERVDSRRWMGAALVACGVALLAL
jgi:drug/metabolite transporter (DMT)-like permease